jgi:hypothetical protein
MPQVDLKQGGAWITTGDPATVNDATPLFVPGQVGVFTPTKKDLPVTGSATALATVQIPRVVQYVQLDAASATPVQGQRLVWKDSLNFVVTTVTSNTSQKNGAAGALLNASATLGNYVWIGVNGVFPLLCTAAAPAAGDAITGTATVAEWGTIAMGTAPLYRVHGDYLGAKAAVFNGVTPAAGVAFGRLDLTPFGS